MDADHVEAMRETAKHDAQNNSKPRVITIRLSEEEHEKVKAAAQRMGRAVSMQRFCLDAILVEANFALLSDGIAEVMGKK